MKLTLEGLQRNIKIAEYMADFGGPITPDMQRYLVGRGLNDGRVVGCMGWNWFQWLLGGPVGEIRGRVEAFVDRGMAMQEISPLYEGRPAHDLFLLHCAIFASSDAQLKKVAERVVDTSGYKGHAPPNTGDLYESAWCGMVKHWILGDRDKAAQQAEIVWKAYRFPNLRASVKPLVTPWLEGDWSSFRKQQQKDFAKLWERIRKDRSAVKEKGEEIVIDMDRFSTKQTWCWAHCGMALLAHRQGAEVVTDDFRFPPHALKCVTPNQ